MTRLELVTDKDVERCHQCGSAGRRGAVHLLTGDVGAWYYRCGMMLVDGDDKPVGYATQRIACEEIRLLRAEITVLRDLCEVASGVADSLAARISEGSREGTGDTSATPPAPTDRTHSDTH